MKIHSIVLKEIDFYEDEETKEYKTVVKNETRHPCVVTNYALKLGKDLGITESSLVSDLFKLSGIDSSDKDEKKEALDGLDQVEMQKFIYLGYIGANRQADFTFDQFLERFHYTFDETVELYMKLAIDAISQDPNKFAKSLKKSTKTEKKTLKPQS